MRFYLQLALDKPELPVEYRRLFMSYIKDCLSKVDHKNTYEAIYHDTAQKEFTWGAELNHPKFTKDCILLGSPILKLHFSVAGEGACGFLLFEAFLKQKNKSFVSAQHTLTLLAIKVEKEQSINATSCIFKTSLGSPLCVRVHDKTKNKDQYLTFLDTNFQNYVTSQLRQKAKQNGFSEDHVSFQWLMGSKVLIKHYHCLIDASVGVFKIEGPALFLNMLYQTGLMSRSTEGFGMAELVAQSEN